MSDTIKIKDASPLVQSVIALDAYFGDIERVGTKIHEMKLKSESDYEQAQKLLARFAERGQMLTEEVRTLSSRLMEVQARASAVAELVSERAETINSRNTDQNEKFEQFRQLGEKVRNFNQAVSQLRKPEGTELSGDDRQAIMSRLLEFDSQLEPLIEEAQGLRKYAYDAKMKSLEQNADSLAQTLQAVRTKIRAISPS